MKHVRIYSIHYNRPDFVKWQYDSFKHHMIDSFALVIVNNARDEILRQEIKKASADLGLECIETHYDDILEGKHHANCFNYIWKNCAVRNSNEYIIMLDGDCFPVSKMNVNDFMKDSILAGPYQQRNRKYHYLTPTIIIADIDNLTDANTIDWEGIGVMENDVEVRLDTGGGLYNYYLKHPEIKAKTKEIKSSWHIKPVNKNKHCLPDQLLSEYDDEYHIEFFGNEILHYCRSSNWNHQTDEHHKRKTEFVKKFVYGTIDGSIVAKEHNFQADEKEHLGWGE